MLKTGFKLVLATALYNSLEAVIAIWQGVQAKSIALIGFGLDSIIELTASLVLLWRLTKEIKGVDVKQLAKIETQTHRFVGLTFLALAFYVVIQSTSTLWQRQIPKESLIGIILAAVSLILMPGLAFKKSRVANQIQSPALKAEAKETLACAYLSFVLLLGLVANATLQWWWADPVAALLMAPWLLKEGIEGLKTKSGTEVFRVEKKGVA